MSLRFEPFPGLPKGRLARGADYEYLIYQDSDIDTGVGRPGWKLQISSHTLASSTVDLDFAYFEDAKDYARQHDSRELDRRKT